MSVDGAVTHIIWSEVLKNKDGTIHPHELIRHFNKRQQKPTGQPVSDTVYQFIAIDVTPVWLRGDDYHQMRSKYLHRDIDIVMKSLKTMVITLILEA